jgi:hypothetical protein
MPDIIRSLLLCLRRFLRDAEPRKRERECNGASFDMNPIKETLN